MLPEKSINLINLKRNSTPETSPAHIKDLYGPTLKWYSFPSIVYIYRVIQFCFADFATHYDCHVCSNWGGGAFLSWVLWRHLVMERQTPRIKSCYSASLSLGFFSVEVSHCMVTGCTNYSRKAMGVSYYRIPKDTSLRQVWMARIRRVNHATSFGPSLDFAHLYLFIEYPLYIFMHSTLD